VWPKVPVENEELRCSYGNGKEFRSFRVDIEVCEKNIVVVEREGSDMVRAGEPFNVETPLLSSLRPAATPLFSISK
jgi:hypothetical protein